MSQIIKKQPIAKRKKEVFTYHNEEYIDYYSWLKDRNNREVIKYMEDENEFTENYMKHYENLQKLLYEEMISRIEEDDSSLPFKMGEYFYYNRMEKGKQYTIYCRKYKDLKNNEEIILDVNEIAKDHSYTEVGLSRISPDHKILAYCVDFTGSETYTLKFINLKTKELLKDSIENIYCDGEWSEDGKYFFYLITDKSDRPYKIFAHKLGSNEDDILIFHEKDEKYYLSIMKTRDKKYLIIDSSSNITSESHIIPAHSPLTSPRIIFPRKYGVEYYIGHRDGFIYYMTNENAPNFKLLKLPVNNLNAEPEEILSHNDDILIEGFDIFQNYEILYLQELGLKKIRIRNYGTDEFHYIEFPEETYTIGGGNNREFDIKKFRFYYESMISPETIYDYDIEKRKLEIKKVQKIPSGYKKNDYETRRIFIKSHDGVEVPISIVYKKGTEFDGNSPLFLTSYGAYGIASDPYFSTSRLSLLDRDFIYVIAHIRGGNELGNRWWMDGRALKKKNSFLDFISVTNFLIENNYSSPEKIIISGGSAGGLLMGAVINMAPELYRGVIAEVPFVDLINTMMDSTLPLTVTEYDEWGDPNIKENFDYMLSYSPYDNVDKKEYPAMLVTAGLNDPRVGFWEPAKWVAKLRHMKRDKNILLLKINMDEGHGGATGRYDFIKEIAFQYSFVISCIKEK